MKKILFFALIVCMPFLSSCTKNPQQEQVQFRVWNGQNFSLEKDYPLPVCIVWQYYSSMGDWQEYKSFSQGVEIQHIIELLGFPEIKEQRPELRTKNKLTLFFSFDVNHVKMFPVTPIKIVELYFDVNDGEFICATGKSKILGKILTDKPESGLYLYHRAGMSGSEKDINTLEKNIESARAEKNKKIDRGEKVNDGWIPSYSYEFLAKMEKTLESIRTEEQKFKEQYGIQESNQPK